METKNTCHPTTLSGKEYDRSSDAFKSYVYDSNGWCQEHPEPDDIPAVESLVESFGKKIRLGNLSISDSQQKLCSVLSDKTCHVVLGNIEEDCKDSTVEKPYRIQIKCGGTTECLDIREVFRDIQKQPGYARKFSPDQIMRIHHLKELSDQKKKFPCLRYSRNPDACKAQTLIINEKPVPECMYHVSSLFNALLGRQDPKRVENECFMAPTLVKKIQEMCRTMGADILQHTLTNLVNETLHQQFEREVIGHISLLESYITKDEIVRLIKDREARIMELSRKELCDELTQYVRVLFPDKVDALTQVEGMLHLVGATNVNVDLLNSLLNKTGLFSFSKETLRTLAILLNIFRFVIENFFVSWSGWLLMFPAGRALLQSLLRDPLQATAFIYSLQISLDPASREKEFLFKHLLMITDTLKINIPWEAIQHTLGGPLVTNLAAQTAATALRQVKWSSFLQGTPKDPKDPKDTQKPMTIENMQEIAKTSAKQIQQLCDNNESLF
jgi:hypothetical protein